MDFLKKFTKRDLGFAVLTGLITGTIAWPVFNFLNVPEFQSISWSALIIAVPIFWILGVLLGYFLGQWFQFFDQFGKFAAIGFTNAAVDFGVLDFLIAASGITSGSGYVGFKTISFIVALACSYMWNKYWTFSATQSQNVIIEFLKFVSVAVVSILINVGVASLIVNYIHPILGLNAEQWANLGAVVGAGIALVFSFIGFRIAVFK